MAESFIQLPPNSTGSKVRAFENSVGPNVVNSQAITITDANGNVMANLASGRIAVDGSGVIQPISVSTLPLPSGAATAAKQPSLGTAGSPSPDVITVQGRSGMTALRVDGSAVTQPISVVSLPLPAGAATAANQPQIGTVGSPSADVMTVQGRSGMTAITTEGNVSHGGTDTGNPVKQGARATTALHSITPVSNNDRTHLYTGTDGVLIVREHSNLESTQSGNLA